VGQNEATLVDELAFVVQRSRADESTVLAQAVREGIRVLYRQTLTEAYLLGQVPRDRVLKELGPESVDEIDYQRDALKRDFAWGLKDG
jgi:hypothetical protein